MVGPSHNTKVPASDLTQSVGADLVRENPGQIANANGSGTAYA